MKKKIGFFPPPRCSARRSFPKIAQSSRARNEVELDPDLSREAKKDSGHVDLWAWIRARVEKKSRVEDPRRGSNTGYRRGGEGSALHIRERGGAEEKPDPPPCPHRCKTLRMHFGCSCEFVRASNARVRAPIVYARGECSRGPRVHRAAMNMHTLIRGAN